MGAGSTTGSVARPAGTRAKLGLLSTLAIVALIAVPATTLAGKGGGTSTPAWIALSSASGALAAAQPRLGASVSFATGYSSNPRNPWVSVMCYQNGSLVYGEGGTPGSAFVLGGASSDWQRAGGSASCRAELGDLYWRGGHQYYTYMAHTNFDAGA